MEENQLQQDETPKKAKRGFALMSSEKRRSIASSGGRAAHQKGVAHTFSAEEAREAGRKGGKAISKNREYMADIGRKGGSANSSNNANQQAGNVASNAQQANNQNEGGQISA